MNWSSILPDSVSDGTLIPTRTIPRLGPQLLSVLRSLRLLKSYRRNFRRARVLYEDLPSLKPSQLLELIPDEIPRQRLERFIRDTFGRIASEEEPVDSDSDDIISDSPDAAGGSESDTTNPRRRQQRRERRRTRTELERWEIDPDTIEFDLAEDGSPKKLVGEGNFGYVQIGMARLGIGRLPVAIKTIHLDPHSESLTRRAVVHEVLAMHNMQHVNVLKTYGCWFNEESQTAHLVLEYCPHSDLTKFRNLHKDLSPTQKLSVLRQICRGMIFIHSKGYVHRDLKLCNVLVAADRKTIKICDFGTCKRRRMIKGTLCGTPHYISPEAFRGDEILNPTQIDVYSFGILAWTFWTGVMPFSGLDKRVQSAYHLLHKIHAANRPMRPSLAHRRLSDCPDVVLRMIAACWSERLDLRPRDFTEVIPAFDDGMKEVTRNARRGGSRSSRGGGNSGRRKRATRGKRRSGDS